MASLACCGPSPCNHTVAASSLSGRSGRQTARGSFPLARPQQCSSPPINRWRPYGPSLPRERR
eukprot:11196942-Lingulodinium_polyedra.AAC.1